MDLAMLRMLYAVYDATLELHALEDFEEMPCQHDCCAPQDWASYQATRKKLYDALMKVHEALATADGATHVRRGEEARR